MHCLACDEILTQSEISRKSKVTGEEFMLCTKCLHESGIMNFPDYPLEIEEDVYMDISGLSHVKPTEEGE